MDWIDCRWGPCEKTRIGHLDMNMMGVLENLFVFVYCLLLFISSLEACDLDTYC